LEIPFIELRMLICFSEVLEILSMKDTNRGFSKRLNGLMGEYGRSF